MIDVAGVAFHHLEIIEILFNDHTVNKPAKDRNKYYCTDGCTIMLYQILYLKADIIPLFDNIPEPFQSDDAHG